MIRIPCPYCECKEVKCGMVTHLEIEHHIEGKRAFFCKKCQQFNTYGVQFGSPIDVLINRYHEAVEKHRLTCDQKYVLTGDGAGYCYICRGFKGSLDYEM